MGAATDHALGRSTNFYVDEEAAFKDGFGTAAQVEFAAGERVDFVSSSMDFSIERIDRMDQKQTRSISQDRVTGKQSIAWSLEANLSSARSDGTAPNLNMFFKAAMGGAFGSNTYALTSTNALQSLRLMREANGVFSEVIYGAWVEEMTISASGGDIPKVSFSGGGCHYALTGTSNVASSSTNLVNVTAGEGHNFMIGSLVTVSNQTDSTVRAISTDALTITGSSSMTGTVIPKVPTAAAITSVVNNGLQGTFSLDGVTTYPITSFDLTLTNGIKVIEDEALTEGASDFIAGYRTVTGLVSVRAKKSDLLALTRRLTYSGGTNRDFDDVPIILKLGPGGTATDTWITMATAELEFGSIDVPESEEAILNIPFKALSSTSVLSDELTLKFNQNG